GCSDIRLTAKFTPVVEANNRPIGDASGHPADHRIRGQIPIIADYGPHDAGEPQTLLRRAQSGPTDSVRGAEPNRPRARVFFNAPLCTLQLVQHELRRAEAQERVRLAMVANFVSGAENRA